ncbi:MAG TPA: hypothetical protein VF898_02030 [Chloroflexota bacterium]
MKPRPGFRILACVAVLCTALLAYVNPAHAGSAPNLLDDNRNGTALLPNWAGDVINSIQNVLNSWNPVCPPFCISAPTPSGRVVPSPRIWNVYWDNNWDADNPPQFSKENLDSLSQQVISSNYFDETSQYGVGPASWWGSSTNGGCLDSTPGSSVNNLVIIAWFTCEVQFPGTGIPYPDDHTLYTLFLPQETASISGPPTSTCSSAGAFHEWSFALELQIDYIGPVPVGISPTFQGYPFAVVPVACAQGSVDQLTYLYTHEWAEGSTDPFAPLGWIDTSLGLVDEFSKGEAGDICQSQGPSPTAPIRLDNGIQVSTYWSNSDGACWPLRDTLTLQASGLPGGVTGQAIVNSPAIFGDSNNHTVNLPYTASVIDGGHFSYSFVSPISGAPGIRYVTSDPGGNGAMVSGGYTHTVTYSQQDYLTVNTSPPSVQPSDVSLTGSNWEADSSVVNLSTDAIIPSGADRYRFDSWTGNVGNNSTPATTIVMNGPQTATANYVLQHDITFNQSGIPGAVPWTVTVDGVSQTGPYSQWFDDGSSHTFAYQSPVPALTPGTQYVLTGTSTASPLLVLATGTVTGNYKTQRLLTVQTSGLGSNLTHITLNGMTLGTANDTTPMAVWLDDGTSLATLSADADVNGAGGVQYFFQNFSPAPPGTLTAPFTTTAAYMTMQQLINGALAGGGITGHSASGFGSALVSTFASVQANMGSTRYAAALGGLTSFINQIQAQCCTPTSGKEISTATSTTLQLDALLTYHIALCLGTNQLSATQMNTDYIYYKTNVTRLGGVVLPPC